MEIGSPFAVSASGLSAQRARLQVIAGNLANAETTRTPEGGPYRRRDVVLQAVEPQVGFDDVLDASAQAQGVEVAGLEIDQAPPRLVFEPGHPDANPAGYVAYPNVNVVAEMTDLMAATRAYEANVTAMTATRKMLEAALEIGR